MTYDPLTGDSTQRTPDKIDNLIAAVKAIEPKRGPQAVLAEDLAVSEAFVAKCIKRRWFPMDRAKTLAELYDVPAVGLIKPQLRADFADMTATA